MSAVLVVVRRPVTRLMERVESLTGRLTMYRLVLVCLGLLAGASLILALLGALAYTPAAIAVCWAVPLTVAYTSNRFLAGLFGVVPHSESSLITGYLVFFVFPPSTDLVAVLGVGLAALLASASKYVLAVRGRHLFNPAAAGAFLVTLCGVYYTGWWVGNPVLLSLSAVAALAILHRTRRLPMAAVFLVVATGIMVVRSLAAGVGAGTALLWPLTSSPVVFFAGFMLSEPLTQPPRRWQQLVEAVVVGTVFSVPMHLGPVYAAPESALLLGNLLAFCFGQRKGIELILRRRRQLTPSTVEFVFDTVRAVHFEPGQYLELTVPHRGSDNRGRRRVFSIASAPTDRHEVAISTRIPEHASSFKRALVALAPGTTVTATSIAGDFVLPRDPDAAVLLVAGGIGITPFASQLATRSPGPARDVVVVYAVADAGEIGYRDVLEASGARVVLVSPEPIDDLPPGWQNVPGQRIDGDLLAAQVPDIGRRQVFVSGPPALVTGVGASARELQAAGVHTDFFSGC